MMELRQLKYFLAVAEELHFGKAAQKLHIAEQPLGYQVRRLENELGFKLFDRTTRSVKLTPAGQSFMADARRILLQTEYAAETARKISAGKAGLIRLGYESATIVAILPGFVKLFRAEYPEIELVLIEHSKAGLGPLRDGDIDACLITRYTRLPDGFEYLPVMKDRAVVALPIDHPLAERQAISLADLRDVPFLGYGGAGGESANRFMAQLVEYVGSDAPITHEADSYIALLGLVASNLGFTIVTSSMARLFAEEVRYIPLVEPSVNVDYGLALRVGESAPTAEALRTVAKHLAKII